MSWTITDNRNAATSIKRILAEYPDAVAYDESGFDVDLDDLADDSAALADAGYSDRASRRILVWATEEDSQNDTGARAIASAEWEE